MKRRMNASSFVSGDTFDARTRIVPARKGKGAKPKRVNKAAERRKYLRDRENY